MPVLEQHLHDRLAEDHQAHRRGMVIKTRFAAKIQTSASSLQSRRRKPDATSSEESSWPLRSRSLPAPVPSRGPRRRGKSGFLRHNFGIHKDRVHQQINRRDPDPDKSGTIRRATRRTPGSVKKCRTGNSSPCGQLGHLKKKLQNASHQQRLPASADAGLAKYLHTAAVEKTMNEMFSRMGVAAGMPKNMETIQNPIARAAIPINRM